MTLRELLGELSALGFDGEIGLTPHVIHSLNRSLRRIFADRQITGEYSFLADGERPILRLPVLTHGCGRTEELPLSGAVYSFFVTGRGSFTLLSSVGVYRKESFDTEGKRYFGTLPDGGAILRLEGEYSFSVYRIVTYGMARGVEGEEIPDGSPTRVLKMRDAVPDFLAFCDQAHDGVGRVLTGVTLRDGTVSYPESYTGEITVRYRRLPPYISGAELDTELPLREDCLTVLPLLWASYVLIDESPELAEYYERLYKEYTERDRGFADRSYNSGYRDTNGWA